MLKNIKIYDKRSKFFCNIIKIEERNRIRSWNSDDRIFISLVRLSQVDNCSRRSLYVEIKSNCRYIFWRKKKLIKTIKMIVSTCLLALRNHHLIQKYRTNNFGLLFDFGYLFEQMKRIGRNRYYSTHFEI